MSGVTQMFGVAQMCGVAGAAAAALKYARCGRARQVLCSPCTLLFVTLPFLLFCPLLLLFSAHVFRVTVMLARHHVSSQHGCNCVYCC